jgi:hypothetical protein
MWALTASLFAPLALAPANRAMWGASERLELEIGHLRTFTRCGRSSHFEIASDKRIYQHLSAPRLQARSRMCSPVAQKSLAMRFRHLKFHPRSKPFCVSTRSIIPRTRSDLK